MNDSSVNKYVDFKPLIRTGFIYIGRDCKHESKTDIFFMFLTEGHPNSQLPSSIQSLQIQFLQI